MDGLDRCKLCGGDISLAGYCLRCGRKDGGGDDEGWLHGIVGGMTALTTVGIGLTVFRILQASKFQRAGKN